MQTKDREWFEAIQKDAVDRCKTAYELHGHNTIPLGALIYGDDLGDCAQIMMPAGVPPGMLYQIVQMMTTQQDFGFEPEGVVLFFDCYTRVVEGETIDQSLDITEHVRDGELQEAFKSGDPTVGEAVMLNFITSRGNKMADIPYVYTNADGWEWKTPRIEAGDRFISWKFSDIIGRITPTYLVGLLPTSE